MNEEWRLSLGAMPRRDGACSFHVWGPAVERMDLHLVAPEERVVPLVRDECGYHSATVPGVRSGARYLLRLDGADELPDPASRSQPEGPHGPSEVVGPGFEWTDRGWFGWPIERHVIYELHVGTFTPEGTFDAVIPRLPYLRELGITAVEIMPIAQFPGRRNWGYDGVYPFAAQNSYGGPQGFRRLVDACHREGLAVVLDVVYNHLGPEGNYVSRFGPYFTPRYQTPWGSALNFDGDSADEVRRFFIESALYWLTECHVDAFRLDAIHAIVDTTAHTFLEDLANAIHARSVALNRQCLLIAESALNDPRVIRPPRLGGYGLDAQWNDDFHHALHSLLTGETDTYYEDFGRVEDLAAAMRNGFYLAGQYSPHRKRRFGAASREEPAHRFVVFAQNHDQVGNRVGGERLSTIVSFERLKLAAAVVMLSPFVPMLFQGEEYGEKAPLLYFIEHSDADLVESVRKGRREEFPPVAGHDFDDPQAEETFRRSQLDLAQGETGEHKLLLEFHRELLRLRREIPALALLSKDHLDVRCWEDKRVLFWRRWNGDSEVFAAANFSDAPAAIVMPIPGGRWRCMLDSAAPAWGGRSSGAAGPVASEGECELRLGPASVLAYERITAT